MAQIDIIIFIVSAVGNFQRDMSASVRTNRLKTGNDIRAHYLLTHCHEIYMQNKFIFIFFLRERFKDLIRLENIIYSLSFCLSFRLSAHLSCSYLVLITAVCAEDILSTNNLLFAEGRVSVVSSDQRLKLIRH